MLWWMWVLIGVGVVLVLFVLALIASKRMQKKDAAEINSPERLDFEKRYAVSDAQRRQLAIGAPLMYSNFESARVFKLLHGDKNPEDLRQGMEHMWGITDRESALEILESLSKAELSSPRAKELFDAVIPSAKRNPKGLLDTFQLKQDFSGVREVLGYEEAYYTLTNIAKDVRYTPEKVEAVRNFEAWDLGRTVFIARNVAHMGFITEAEGWAYIEAASNLASRTYFDWNEFLAAYYLGRGLTYGGKIQGGFAEVELLLRHDTNPFKGISFR
ncbi:MAG: DUF1266 domain-containing protein [Defluviitaleaceae bacterium]|nr:DUF1266 domain-containing protein [Defluviitaleaceae bacterium]